MQSNYFLASHFIVLKTCEGNVVVHAFQENDLLGFIHDIGLLLWEGRYFPEMSSEILQIFVQGRECFRPELEKDGTVRIHRSIITDDPEDRIMEFRFPFLRPYWKAPDWLTFAAVRKKPEA